MPPTRERSSPVEGAATAFQERAARAGVVVEGVLSSGPLRVDLARYTVELGSRELSLSPRQVELLALFLAAPGRVWSREQLHRICWDDVSPSRRVDVQLCRIRSRTGVDLFRNVRERGWSLRSSLGGEG
jgi:DNA-binding response OmpR family regulator